MAKIPSLTCLPCKRGNGSLVCDVEFGDEAGPLRRNATSHQSEDGMLERMANCVRQIESLIARHFEP